jgi:predicted cupin superfamily sugar epimerase
MTRQSAKYWIRQLKLEAHPEGGYFKEVYRACEFIQKKGLPNRYTGFRAFSTSIYFLLTGDQFSAFHRLKSDEVWHFYQGDPLVLHILAGNGKHLSVHIGPDLTQKQYLQFVIPRGAWFAAHPLNINGYSLLGCTVAPGFDFDDFELGGRDYLNRTYPHHKELIDQFTIRP